MNTKNVFFNSFLKTMSDYFLEQKHIADNGVDVYTNCRFRPDFDKQTEEHNKRIEEEMRYNAAHTAYNQVYNTSLIAPINVRACYNQYSFLDDDTPSIMVTPSHTGVEDLINTTERFHGKLSYEQQLGFNKYIGEQMEAKKVYKLPEYGNIFDNDVQIYRDLHFNSKYQEEGDDTYIKEYQAQFN